MTATSIKPKHFSISPDQMSFGIYLQKQNIDNTCLLISKIRSAFPTNTISVFYSGSLINSIKKLKALCNDLGVNLQIELMPQTIGIAANALSKTFSTPWFAVCDGDILPTNQTMTILQNGIHDIPEGVKAIQGLNLPQVGANVWAKFDALNDTMAFIRDRRQATGWFSQDNIVIPEHGLISTLHGGILFIELRSFLDVGGYDEDNPLVQRSFAAKLIRSGHGLWFERQIQYIHTQPTTLKGIIRRKIFHAKGSALNRIRYPELYKDSLLTRIKMLNRAFFPPKDFSSMYGRIYFFISMFTFTLAITYYLYKFRCIIHPTYV